MDWLFGRRTQPQTLDRFMLEMTNMKTELQALCESVEKKERPIGFLPELMLRMRDMETEHKALRESVKKMEHPIQCLPELKLRMRDMETEHKALRENTERPIECLPELMLRIRNMETEHKALRENTERPIQCLPELMLRMRDMETEQQALRESVEKMERPIFTERLKDLCLPLLCMAGGLILGSVVTGMVLFQILSESHAKAFGHALGEVLVDSAKVILKVPSKFEFFQK